MKRERIEEIADLLDKRGKLTLEQLDEQFPNVSQMTLRRDLFQLEQEGRIIRVRGGAMSVKEVQKVSGEPYTKKTTIHTDVKIKIAQKAASLIDENCSLFMDGGTTAMYLAKEMPDKNLHIFTNGLAVAIELAQKKNFHVTMLGRSGDEGQSLPPPHPPSPRPTSTTPTLNSPSSRLPPLPPKTGSPAALRSEADLLKLVRSKAKATYMMLDSSKIGKIMPYTFAHIEDIDVLITDDNFPAQLKEEFTKRNIVVM